MEDDDSDEEYGDYGDGSQPLMHEDRIGEEFEDEDEDQEV